MRQSNELYCLFICAVPLSCYHAWMVSVWNVPSALNTFQALEQDSSGQECEGDERVLRLFRSYGRKKIVLLREEMKTKVGPKRDLIEKNT